MAYRRSPRINSTLVNKIYSFANPNASPWIFSNRSFVASRDPCEVSNRQPTVAMETVDGNVSVCRKSKFRTTLRAAVSIIYIGAAADVGIDWPTNNNIILHSALGSDSHFTAVKV